ncbi:PadR family transcriptional regulator [Actinoplanes sp. NPDC051346]|uniref:PadR family transcriptional regulator n=1 Tax=Actinoplanes sp. NPDC051346 TaxID=3155048 RepID=UPI003444FAAF
MTSRMREPSYFILASLQDEPLHGYAIITQAADLSQGRVRLATGTLYAALDRLAGEGMIESVREEIVNGRARRYYALTPAGDAALRAEAEALTQAARVVTDRAVRRAAPRPAVGLA